jgi:hypothetical protein
MVDALVEVAALAVETARDSNLFSYDYRYFISLFWKA